LEISLLPVFSKIFEKVIYKRLYYHLTLNNILVKEQFHDSKESTNMICLNFPLAYIYSKCVQNKMFLIGNNEYNYKLLLFLLVVVVVVVVKKMTKPQREF
jgi:dolichyl-phosphate-mannose--protein O-mannosyl transferase